MIAWLCKHWLRISVEENHRNAEKPKYWKQMSQIMDNEKKINLNTLFALLFMFMDWSWIMRKMAEFDENTDILKKCDELLETISDEDVIEIIDELSEVKKESKEKTSTSTCKFCPN